MSQSADKQHPPRSRSAFDTASYEQPSRRQPRQPHERDESARATGEHEKPARTGSEIEQAAEDIKRGVVDTERRGVPNDVPGRQ